MRSIIYKIIGTALAILVVTGCRTGCIEADWTRGVSSTCQVHAMQMSKTVVPIVYGLPCVSDWGNAYDRASKNSFPHAEEVALGGCIVGSAKQVVVFVCPQCRLARKVWESEHPKPRIYTEESVAGEWIGLNMGWRTEVFRLILKSDRTGVLTQAATDSANEADLYRYEIAKWRVATNDLLECEFQQRDIHEPLRMTGTMTAPKAGSFTAILHNGEGGWKQSVLFWREEDLDAKLKALRPQKTGSSQGTDNEKESLEKSILPGMTWEQVMASLKGKWPRPAQRSKAQLMDWARKNSKFTGDLLHDPNFLNSTKADQFYRVFSEQGFVGGFGLRTDQQLVIVFEENDETLRVVFRKIAGRPCS